MIVIDRNAPWILELAWLISFLAELGHERVTIIVTREYLHSMSHSIAKEQETSMMVEHQAHRIVELASSIAWFLGADRELDSSIMIKSIVSHLFHFNLSPSHNDKEMIQAKLLKQMQISLSGGRAGHGRFSRLIFGGSAASLLPSAPRPSRSLFVALAASPPSPACSA